MLLDAARGDLSSNRAGLQQSCIRVGFCIRICFCEQGSQTATVCRVRDTGHQLLAGANMCCYAVQRHEVHGCFKGGHVLSPQDVYLELHMDLLVFLFKVKKTCDLSVVSMLIVGTGAACCCCCCREVGLSTT